MTDKVIPDKIPVTSIPVVSIDLPGIEQVRNAGIIMGAKGHERSAELVAAARSEGHQLFKIKGGGYFVADEEMARKVLAITDRDSTHRLIAEFLGPDAVFTMEHRHHLESGNTQDNPHYHTLNEAEATYYNSKAAERYIPLMAGHTLNVLNKHFRQALNLDKELDFGKISAEIAVGNAFRIIGYQNSLSQEFLEMVSRYITKGELISAMETMTHVKFGDIHKRLQYPGGKEKYYEDQAEVFSKLKEIMGKNLEENNFAGLIGRNVIEKVNKLEVSGEEREKAEAEIELIACKRLISIIAAAGLTTYGAIQSTVKWLSSNPGIINDLKSQVDKLREDEKYKAGDLLTADILKSIDGIDNMMRYILWKAPPLANIPHGVQVDTEVTDDKGRTMTLKKGNSVMVPAYAFSALDSENHVYNSKYKYSSRMAFARAAGNLRACVGAPIAEEELSVVIFSLIEVLSELGVDLKPQKLDSTLSNLVAGFEPLRPEDNTYTVEARKE